MTNTRKIVDIELLAEELTRRILYDGYLRLSEIERILKYEIERHDPDRRIEKLLNENGERDV